MKILCYSVTLQSLVWISDKAYKATFLDGTRVVIPKSQIMGVDFDISGNKTFYITQWILDTRGVQYSKDKSRWFDGNGKMLPTYIFEMHVPEKKIIKKVKEDKSLLR